MSGDLRPTERFGERVTNYVRYRPGYPAVVVEHLAASHGLRPEHTIADLGSGTGLLAVRFLEHGNRVLGIEPNGPMRAAGDAFLAEHARFESIDATAEATGLPDASVDLVTAGQAFHWFDPLASAHECARILKSGGLAALIWNIRKKDTSPFLADYETLLHTFGSDYPVVAALDLTSREELFFDADGHEKAVFPNEQWFDLPSLRGRLLSASYAPQAGEPNHEPMLRRLDELFEIYAVSGRVRFEYDCDVLVGRPSANSP